jgi:hypothetical protein
MKAPSAAYPSGDERFPDGPCGVKYQTMSICPVAFADNQSESAAERLRSAAGGRLERQCTAQDRKGR